MAEQTIVGVDFSGSKSDVPWIATGVLSGGNLVLEKCEPIPREDLKKRLRNLPGSAVAAMDFPFGVPQQFVSKMDFAASFMPDLWRVASRMEYQRFEQLRNSFVKRHSELIRWGDTYFDGPLSPLKTGGPNMLPMTFRGMEMLYELWKSGCRIPPLDRGNHEGATLLETMPGIWLRHFNLPHEKYKGTGDSDLNNRKTILDGLEKVAPISLEVAGNIRDCCLRRRTDGHNGLDSVVAAIAAALWVKERNIFLEPHCTRPVAETQADAKRWERVSPDVKQMTELEAAQLEGWIYAPKK